MGDEREAARSLYGDESGRWAILEMSLGIVGPWPLKVGISRQGTADLTYLGPPIDAVTALYNRCVSTPTGGRTGGGAAQEAIASLLGVGQQAVSRYIAGTSEPRLSDDGWRNLVLATFHPSLVTDRIDELAGRRTRELADEAVAGAQ